MVLSFTIPAAIFITDTSCVPFAATYTVSVTSISFSFVPVAFVVIVAVLFDLSLVMFLFLFMFMFLLLFDTPSVFTLLVIIDELFEIFLGAVDILPLAFFAVLCVPSLKFFSVFLLASWLN